MKKIHPAVALFAVSLFLTTLAEADVPRRLLNAIRFVESGNNDSAVGDNGNAIGPYQIWRSYWKDAVEYDPTIGGKYEDCFNRDYAERIVNAYMDRYANERRLGRTPTFEDIARIHNGGPNGHKKRATIKYWEKVLDRLRIVD